MPKIGIANILIGFIVIVIASCGGFFLATDADKAFLIDKNILSSWQYTLFKSAHGHFNLFGMLHILMGLSLPYSLLSRRWKILQSCGLFLGTFTMGALLVLRGYTEISGGLDLLGIIIGINLMAAVCALIIHCYGLALKLI
jgi:hypothetical protein